MAVVVGVQYATRKSLVFHAVFVKRIFCWLTMDTSVYPEMLILGCVVLIISFVEMAGNWWFTFS